MKKWLISKYLDNKCSDNDVDNFFSSIIKDKEQYHIRFFLKNLWDKIQLYEEQDHDKDISRLNHIHHKININQSRKARSGSTKKIPVLQITPVQLLSRVAVWLLIPLLTIFIYNKSGWNIPGTFQTAKSQLNTIVAPVGSRISLELSDGTKVWLNQGSKLVYPQKFTGKSRKVELTGEGFFEIATNRSKPFFVETEEMTVKATGTSFNVKSYPGDRHFETTLVTGEVVILKSCKNGQRVVRNMEPNQHFSYNIDSKKYYVANVNPHKYFSWKDGKLIFDEDPLDVVCERLSKWYNVDIKLENEELKKLTYKATFVDETLFQALEMLEIVTPISYNISERKLLEDGTYSKRKISIYLKEKF